MVGLYAEPLPKGFGFSDTAFRVFILMASRRLKSDRFFTTDYTRGGLHPDAGSNWIDDNSMSTVLLRHYPGARARRCADVDNAVRAVDAHGTGSSSLSPGRDREAVVAASLLPGLQRELREDLGEDLDLLGRERLGLHDLE